jgi:cytochrome d ubiquinol oxidase subunit I
VATGIVQEFQFGMAWSDYSRYVGDIFGAPLAIEGLLAFFLESTFLGLWIFGWDRLSKRVHCATIWAAAIGTWLSAYFILAANSWMQHPVGYKINTAHGRAELTDFPAVLLNSTTLGAFPHVIFASFMAAAAVMIGVAAWHLARGQHTDVMRPSLKLASWVMIVAALGVVISGDAQARIMTKQQPMKMAAAEALYDTVAPASFSVFTVGSLDGSKEVISLRVPRLLSFMATGSWDGKVEGINNVQQAEAAKYGAGDYKPIVPITYWSFRLMIGLGMLGALLAAFILFVGRKGRAVPRWVWRAAVWAIPLQLVAIAFGWIFTEMGRQPWSVYGTLRTADSVSPSMSMSTIVISLTIFTVLYAILAVIEFGLMVTYAKAGPEPAAPPPGGDSSPDSPGKPDDAEHPLAFAY